MRKLFTLIAILACAMSVQAQLKLGLKGGLNVTNFSSDNFDSRSRILFHLGAFGNYGFSDNWSFQGELLYSQQGSKVDALDDFGFEIGEQTNKVNYLNIPLLMRFHSSVGFTAGAGIQVGLLLSAEAEIKLDNNFTGLTPEPIDLKEFTTDTDLGFLLDAGYELPSGLSVHARVVLGVTDIAKDEGDGTVNNRTYQLSLAFPLFAN